ncbi:hypothetical protein DICSQDRAFT_135733 [Dichomitus squalens LYAD-421 SS1]|uniref:Uncharacterized protein n=2 Tax=Dichomitus squalens TaxID=114155 RepID=A0A4Q9PVU2_9APHY|nr:uncharacterized protein DICSQDRAFT_135733 [Dichomitus squalens LYAD-421 SS1]EJF62142.1 hypothetical protein DICSQDRAFT_135733 [Dichomitus squalens LYAD-421 SS1]TBU23989.1 hypothetical protein BD311DRAFT_672787 [Dichomitus squalens]TBU58635.1 hypothetical protein BD310DRAFT_948544 [Dichomitus squalens]
MAPPANLQNLTAAQVQRCPTLLVSAFKVANDPDEDDEHAAEATKNALDSKVKIW